MTEQKRTHSPDSTYGGPAEHAALDRQQSHWMTTYTEHPQMFGAAASAPAEAAAELFRTEGVSDLSELGAGQGRDTRYFGAEGLCVQALDYAQTGIDALRALVAAAGLESRITVLRHDVREQLPFADERFDACYSHMLFNMALTTPELERLCQEVRRVLRPGGLHVYTVRSTADPHYRKGIAHSDEMYETGGFIVHFFSRSLVEQLAAGYDLVDVTEFEESPLPRRLFRVTMRRPKP
jgi:SAM-dependent methyltransferase